MVFCVGLTAQSHPHLQEIYQYRGWKEKLYLGDGLLNAGDINQDGFIDYISYSPNNDSAMFFWGAFPVDTIPDVVFHEIRPGGFSKPFVEMTIANIDGDSLQELIIPFRGSTNQTSIHKLQVGMDSIPDMVLAEGGNHITAGDLNGDGYDDIILSNPVAANYRGRIVIFLGGEPFDTQPDYIFTGDSIDHELGIKLDVGDLNGDGYDDLVVWGRSSLSDTDYIRIYKGAAVFDTLYDYQMKDPSVNPGNVGFTNFWLTSFDYNLDGYEDLFVGGFFIYNGSSNFDTIPEFHLIWPDSSFNAYAGANLFDAGDINKDGYPDLAIGMPNMFGSNGLVHVRLGGNNGFDENYIIMEPDPPVTSRFGSGIINIGDLDGNGVSDLLIGAPFYTLARSWGKLHFYSGDSTLVSSTVGIHRSGKTTPAQFELYHNYPNPFNPTTTIKFTLPRAAKVRLEIFNILGQRVRTLVNGKLPAGVRQVQWDGRNDAGQAMASGVYIYRLRAGNHIQSRKMLLLR